MNDLFTFKGASIFFLSIIWVYIIARMIGRAWVRTLEDKDKTNKNKRYHE